MSVSKNTVFESGTEQNVKKRCKKLFFSSLNRSIIVPFQFLLVFNLKKYSCLQNMCRSTMWNKIVPTCGTNTYLIFKYLQIIWNGNGTL